MKLNAINPQQVAHTVARIIIASYFLAKAIGLIFDPNSFDIVFATTPIPEYFRWPDMMFQFVAATFILIGFQTRLAAALLAMHVFWTSFIFNYVPGDPVAISAFWKDLAMIGGLILLFSHGRGALALDGWFAKRDIERRRRARAEAAHVPEAPAPAPEAPEAAEPQTA